MAGWATSSLKSELIGRRARLESARAQADSADVERLLREVDTALERIDQGTYGLCAVCHDPIEKDRLMADCLMTVCLDHLDANQRRALEEDLALALRIQTKLLPERGLQRAGWAAHFHYQPLGVVSGDFCDLAPLEGERLFFMVGDVAGKGVAASLLMSHMHATFRTLLSVGTPIGDMLTRANRLFSNSTMPSHYATVACGFADRSGKVEISNAGQCPPLIVREKGIERIEPTGLPLGMFADGQYSSCHVRLRARESIILYTDGLTEARNRSDEEYGVERLMKVLSRCEASSPEDISTSCLEDLAGFLSGERTTDDLTVMVLRRGEA